jgi:hypothetical protein
MNWVKSNWLIVVLSVVALAALPTMFFFSSKMSKGLRDKVQRDAAAAEKEVTGSTVSYGIPDVKRPDQKVFEKNTDVNEILTKKIAQVREAIKSEGALLGAEAVKFNQGNHRPLVDGVFPTPGGISQKYQFAREYIENMPKRLLDEVNAKGPMEPARLAAELADYKKAREERMKAVGGAAQADPEEAEKLKQELLAQRMDRYRAWAQQTSFYAEISTGLFVDNPMQVPNPIPPMSRLWDWQMRAWVTEDLLRGFAQANAAAAGGAQGNVTNGVVKRVVKIAISNADYTDTADETPADQIVEAQVAEAKNPVAPDMTQSITGRYSGPQTGNRYYDLRTATVELIVAPEKLPYLFDALAQVNFMTVLKIEMENLDAVDELTKGYYYGTDHVVRATMTVETIWLRDWMKQYMPKTVKSELGIKDEAPAPAGDQVPPQ